VPTPFERLPYSEAMARFGSDKPDTRFGLELMDVTDAVRSSSFVVFHTAIEAGGSVRAICVKGAADTLTRKEIDKLVDVAKTYGAKGLAYTRWTTDAKTSSFEKFLTEEEVAALYAAANFAQGDVLLVAADADSNKACTVLGAVRLALGDKLDLIDKSKFNFLWVTDFPFFEYSEEEGRWMAMHHPFTMPRTEDLPYVESDPGRVKALAYDMVLNGCELGGGSIRINDPVIQNRMLKALGFTEERARESFGFLMDAYRYGAPPHGGMAFGFDRMVMLMLGRDSIRDVIAFPKVQNAGEPMSGCPETVEQKQLAELHIISTAETQGE
jgi:aspartyl-tRNA synthetase